MHIYTLERDLIYLYLLSIFIGVVRVGGFELEEERVNSWPMGVVGRVKSCGKELIGAKRPSWKSL